MQAQMVAMLATCQGMAAVAENVFENRFGHVNELKRMGADISVHGRIALIRGVERLHCAQVCSRDLRGGAALVIAGLGAEGVTTVENVQYIDRGYDEIETVLRG
jgi:UDP-N-acetylglucosamine 1-carboxyvinyltransferase